MLLWWLIQCDVKTRGEERLMILRRALAREVLLTSGAVTVVIFCIFLVVRVLGFLRQAAEGIIPIDSIFLLLFLKVIAYMDVILPLMMFVAILMVLGRWSRENEMTIMMKPWHRSHQKNQHPIYYQVRPINISHVVLYNLQWTSNIAIMQVSCFLT